MTTDREPCPHRVTSTNIPPQVVNPANYRITCLTCQKEMTEQEYDADREECVWTPYRERMQRQAAHEATIESRLTATHAEGVPK